MNGVRIIAVLNKLALTIFASVSLSVATACATINNTALDGAAMDIEVLADDYAHTLAGFGIAASLAHIEQDLGSEWTVEGVRFVLSSDIVPNILIGAERYGFSESISDDGAVLYVKTFEPKKKRDPHDSGFESVWITQTTIDSFEIFITGNEFNELADSMKTAGLFGESSFGELPDEQAVCGHITHGYFAEAKLNGRVIQIWRAGCYNGDYSEDLKYAAPLVELAIDRMPVAKERISSLAGPIKEAANTQEAGEE